VAELAESSPVRLFLQNYYLFYLKRAQAATLFFKYLKAPVANASGAFKVK
jgi:hypothetical protein